MEKQLDNCKQFDLHISDKGKIDCGIGMLRSILKINKAYVVKLYLDDRDNEEKIKLEVILIRGDIVEYRVNKLVDYDLGTVNLQKLLNENFHKPNSITVGDDVATMLYGKELAGLCGEILTHILQSGLHANRNNLEASKLTESKKVKGGINLSQDPEAKRTRWIDLVIDAIKESRIDDIGRLMQQFGALLNTSGIAIPNGDKEFWEKMGAIVDLQNSMGGAQWWTVKEPNFQPVTVDTINAESFEGRLLLVALAMIETELRTTKSSDEILQELVEVSESKWI